MSKVPVNCKSQLDQEVDKPVDRDTIPAQKVTAENNQSMNEDETQEYQELSNIEKELDAEIEKMKAELDAVPSMKDTMDRLHEYNDIKDAAQLVLGAIASMHGVTIASLHREYNLPVADD